MTAAGEGCRETRPSASPKRRSIAVLDRVGRNGEVGGFRGAHHIGVPGRIERQPVDRVVRAAAQIRGIHQRGSVGSQLGDEAVAARDAHPKRGDTVAGAHGETWLDGVSSREISRLSGSRDHDVSLRIHRNAAPGIRTISAQPGGV